MRKKREQRSDLSHLLGREKIAIDLAFLLPIVILVWHQIAKNPQCECVFGIGANMD